MCCACGQGRQRYARYSAFRTTPFGLDKAYESPRDHQVLGGGGAGVSSR